MSVPRATVEGEAAPVSLNAADVWYPCAFSADIAPGALIRVEILGRGFVLFRDGSGEVRALPDLCPHRMARLSDGRLRDGTVECGYHGWQFCGDGGCARIPQLAPGQPIPDRAHLAPVPVRCDQGVVWLFGGAAQRAPAMALPLIEALDRPDCRTVDFAMDLPYGQEFLVENVLDYAHIHIAHDRTRGGGLRERAGPIAFQIEDHGAAGFGACLGALRDGALDAGPQIARAEAHFVAPLLVHYHTDFVDGRYSGLALYALPTGAPPNGVALAGGGAVSPGCRILYRAYGNHWSLRDRMRPSFWEHGSQCHLLEEDMAIIVGQAAEIAASDRSLAQQWLPLKTSDSLVLLYRKWIDEHGRGLHGAVGLRQRFDGAGSGVAATALDRWSLHGRHCRTCTRTLRAARYARTAAWGAIAAGAVAGIALVVAFGFGIAALSLALEKRLTGGSQPPSSQPPASPQAGSQSAGLGSSGLRFLALHHPRSHSDQVSP